VLAELELLEQAQHLSAAVRGQLQPAAGSRSRGPGQACVFLVSSGAGVKAGSQQAAGRHSMWVLPLGFRTGRTHLSRSSDSCTGGMSSAVSIRTSCWLSRAAARPSAAGSGNGGCGEVRYCTQ
jgi:hypothetical protein